MIFNTYAEKMIHFIWFGKIISDERIAYINSIRSVNTDYKVYLWISKNQLKQDNLDSLIPSIEKKLINVTLKLIEDLEINYSEIGEDFIYDKAIRYIYSEIATNTYFLIAGFDDKGQKVEKKQSCRNYASGADIARFLILYIYGGIYSDVDNEFKKRLGSIKIKDKYTKMIMDGARKKQTNKIYTLNNNFIATIKNNEFFLEGLKLICFFYDQIFKRNFLSNINSQFTFSEQEFKIYNLNVINTYSQISKFVILNIKYATLMNKRDMQPYRNPITCSISGPYFFKTLVALFIATKNPQKNYNTNTAADINSLYENDNYFYNNLVIDSSYVIHNYEHSWLESASQTPFESVNTRSYNGLQIFPKKN